MTQNEELDKIFFVTFCMEQYKHEHNMTGKEVPTFSPNKEY